MRSTVKWFHNRLGYGFINHKDNQDVFAHYSNIIQDGYKTLEEGQEVEYQLLETAKGLQAIKIIPIKEVK
ncbi:MAG: cold shock domain-containing protein [Firmicutes bacterium]|nr:cold shock domain-containing protein [Bacillota bacterium]